ncbi:MAG: AAA family ATPase [Gemmatimonadetes bacterium]|nr:AAA family ATPase [Gemmatimonadota bacterium]MYA40918.1 AAA family ATPase [Gemmatimonadota bacterium]MYE93856.1 AAA family ATPase [Gemmatimonadota bacterium]MYJ11511.1 AAA family ATPase [Gemmatimonadota bacterium]
MRFESIEVVRYGCLTNLSTGEDPLPNIVVVLGPNESGKSTLFDLMSTLVYGFRPATRTRHPFTPWAGGDPEGRARIRLDQSPDAPVIEVHRRLRSQAWGRLHVGERVDDIRNHPLPAAGHVTRVVFRQVYALTLAELAGLEGESWDLVQDRLVGAMAAPDLHSARTVAAGLEDEAKRLWRPDRRGRPRVRVLAAELAALNERKRDALYRDRAVREKVAERAGAETRLQALREERSRERERHGVIDHQLNRLLPVRRALARIDELRAEAGAASDLKALPNRPAQRLSELREEARAEKERVALLAGRRQETVAAGTEGERLRARWEEHAGALFAEPPGDDAREALVAVSTDELRGRVRAFEAAREDRRVAEEGLLRGEDDLPVALKPARSRLVAGVVLLLVGVAIAALTLPQVGVELPLGNAFALRVGAVAAIGGFLLTILWWDADRRARRYGKATADARGRRSGQVAQLREAEEAARREAVSLVAALPLRDNLLEAPDMELPARIERMLELLATRDERATATRRDLERAEGDLAAARRDHEAVTDRLRDLEAGLAELGDGDVERGARRAAARTEAAQRADQMRAELEREWPELDRVEAEIRETDAAGTDWTSLAEALRDASGRHDALAEEGEELRSTITRLDTEIRHLQEGDTPDRVEGRIQEVKERIRDAKEARDRSFLLARIVREADRRFRDQHQPDLLRRAADHLRHITAGRYEHIEMGDTGDEAFYLSGPAASEPRKVGQALSQGTREQVYLALRLAIIDHLDAGQERLPLFMDETLVNWDAWRRDRAFGLLERVAEKRQVFVFTCHPAMAAELEDRGGRIVALGER